MRHPWSIARRIGAVQLLLLAVIALFAGWAAYLQGREVALDVEQRHVVGVATVVAHDDDLRAAVAAEDPAVVLGDFVRARAEEGELSWLTVRDADGGVLATTAPDRPGRGQTEAAGGGTVADVASGHGGGLDVWTAVPVRSEDGGHRVVAVVEAGVQVTEMQMLLAAQFTRLVLIVLAFGAVGVLSSWLVGRYLSRVTLGRGPEDLAESFLLSEAAMDSLGAALVVLGPDGTVRQHNRAAVSLLGLPDPARTEHDDGPLAPASRGAPRPPRLPEDLAAALGDRAETEFPLSYGDRLFMVQQRRIGAGPRRRGAVLAGAAREGVSPAPAGTRVLLFHDRTDLQRLADDLSVARTLTAALRSQTHEHANRLHTALSLVEAGRLDSAKQVLSHRPQAGTDTEDVAEALLRAKAAQAAEAGVEFTWSVEIDAPPPLAPLDLVSVVGNLVDNALDAVGAAAVPEDRRWVDVEVVSDESGLVVQVADGGPGPSPDDLDRIFAPGFSTKPAGAAGRGVGLPLVRGIAKAAGGSVEIATDSGTVVTAEVPPAASPSARGPAGADHADEVPEGTGGKEPSS